MIFVIVYMRILVEVCECLYLCLLLILGKKKAFHWFLRKNINSDLNNLLIFESILQLSKERFHSPKTSPMSFTRYTGRTVSKFLDTIAPILNTFSSSVSSFDLLWENLCFDKVVNQENLLFLSVVIMVWFFKTISVS